MEVARLAALEALADARIGPLTREELTAELAAHFPEETVDLNSLGSLGSLDLDAARRARSTDWAAVSVTYGEVLDAFATYCRNAIDDVEVLTEGPTRLELGWRRERSTVELRAGFLFCERLGTEAPALLLGDLGAVAPARFALDDTLRARVALFDLGRLEKVNAVRSSVFVHFEWFLRELYGVKLVPANAFTQGLIERGVISLGMG